MNKKNLPVIIRMRKDGEGWTPVAFFPTLPGTSASDLLCYERVGQHSNCCISYMQSCVTPKTSDSDAVAALLREIRFIYEEGADAVTLVQRRRYHQQYANIRRQNYDRYLHG